MPPERTPAQQPIHPAAQPCTPPGASAFARCFAASVLSLVSTLYVNGVLNEAYAGVTTWARDWSTATGVALFLVFVWLGKTRPQLIRPRAFSAGAAVLVAAGTAVSSAGLAGKTAAAVVLGGCLTGAAGVWITLVWLLACSTLALPRALVCIAGGGCIAIPLAIVTAARLPFGAVVCIDVASTLGILALTFPVARAFFARLAGAGSPSDREVSHPDAFLPYGHQLFACILAFSFAYGYAMRHAVPQGQLELYAPAALALLCTAAYAALAKARLKIDALFTVSFAFVLGGFLLVVLDDPRVIPAASSLLVGGYLCFNVLMWFVLCNIAARNPLDAIPVMSWGLATSYLGIFVGAQLGIVTAGALAEDRLAIKLVIAGVLTFMVLYAQVAFRKFSFDATVEGIEPETPEVEVRYIDRLEERCDAAAAEHALTQREHEVMDLLARGNNARRIQETLGISHNTVKYHARNIYAKLGVHSQQELIDLLARER